MNEKKYYNKLTQEEKYEFDEKFETLSIFKECLFMVGVLAFMLILIIVTAIFDLLYLPYEVDPFRTAQQINFEMNIFIGIIVVGIIFLSIMSIIAIIKKAHKRELYLNERFDIVRRKKK